jgi:transposase-like protein
MDCSRTFVLSGRGVRKRYGLDVRDEVVRMYVEDGVTTRAVARRLRERCTCEMDPSTVWRILEEAGRRCKTPAEVATELKPRWSGWLKLDGKAVKIYGEDYTVLFARDRTGDLVDGVLAWAEDKECWKAFCEDLKDRVGYKLRGLTSDMRDELIWAIKEVYGDVPHQYCAFHMSQIVDERTGYKAFRSVLKKYGAVYNDLTHRMLTLQYKGLPSVQLALRRDLEAQRICDLVKAHSLELTLRGWTRRFLMASSKREAAHHMAQIVWLKRPCRGRKKLKSLIDSLFEKRKALVVHLDHPELSRTNNELEELIRQFQRRVKTMDGFGKEESTEGFLNLWMIQYRFKAHGSCRGRNRWKNGKSPLEMAGVATSGVDWVRFSQAKNSNS